MKSKNRIWVSLLILMIASSAVPLSSSASSGDRDAVERAISHFYGALNMMFTGDLAEMKEVWSHADDVTFMGPAGGFEIGWDRVLKVWEEQAALKLGGKVEPVDMRITTGGDIAIASLVEQGENIGADGEKKLVSIRATNIFRKEHGKWMMIGHHTDLLPFLEK